MQIVEIAHSFRPPCFFLSFTMILSDSPLLASIRCLVDELDDICGHGKKLSYLVPYPLPLMLFFICSNTRQRARSTGSMQYSSTMYRYLSSGAPPPLYFYSAGRSGSFHLVYPLRALVLRNVLLSPTPLSSLSLPPKFSLFLSSGTIYLLPAKHDNALYSYFLSTLVFYPIS